MEQTNQALDRDLSGVGGQREGNNVGNNMT